MQANQLPKKTAESTMCTEIFVTILVYVPFLVSFGIFTNDESYYFPCSKSSSAYHWSHITWIFLLVTTIFIIIFSPLLTCLAAKSEGSTGGCLLGLLNAGRSMLGIVSFTCYIGLCVSYSEDEKCGKLEDLILGYIIVLSIMLGIIVVACCCGICMGGLVLGTALAANQGLQENIIEGQAQGTQNSEPSIPKKDEEAQNDA